MSDIETNRDGRVIETRRSGGAGWLIALVIIVALVVAAFAFGFINIDQTREGSVPTVKLETSGGQAPTFDVDTAKIAVGEKEANVKVPTIDVGTKDSSVTVPTISMDRAGDPNKSDK